MLLAFDKEKESSNSNTNKNIDHQLKQHSKQQKEQNKPPEEGNDRTTTEAAREESRYLNAFATTTTTTAKAKAARQSSEGQQSPDTIMPHHVQKSSSTAAAAILTGKERMTTTETVSAESSLSTTTIHSRKPSTGSACCAADLLLSLAASDTAAATTAKHANISNNRNSPQHSTHPLPITPSPTVAARIALDTASSSVVVVNQDSSTTDNAQNKIQKNPSSPIAQLNTDNHGTPSPATTHPQEQRAVDTQVQLSPPSPLKSAQQEPKPKTPKHTGSSTHKSDGSIVMELHTKNQNRHKLHPSPIKISSTANAVTATATPAAPESSSPPTELRPPYSPSPQNYQYQYQPYYTAHQLNYQPQYHNGQRHSWEPNTNQQTMRHCQPQDQQKHDHQNTPKEQKQQQHVLYSPASIKRRFTSIANDQHHPKPETQTKHPRLQSPPTISSHPTSTLLSSSTNTQQPEQRQEQVTSRPLSKPVISPTNSNDGCPTLRVPESPTLPVHSSNSVPDTQHRQQDTPSPTTPSDSTPTKTQPQTTSTSSASPYQNSPSYPPPPTYSTYPNHAPPSAPPTHSMYAPHPYPHYHHSYATSSHAQPPTHNPHYPSYPHHRHIMPPNNAPTNPYGQPHPHASYTHNYYSAPPPPHTYGRYNNMPYHHAPHYSSYPPAPPTHHQHPSHPQYHQHQKQQHHHAAPYPQQQQGQEPPPPSAQHPQAPHLQRTIGMPPVLPNTDRRGSDASSSSSNGALVQTASSALCVTNNSTTSTDRRASPLAAPPTRVPLPSNSGTSSPSYWKNDLLPTANRCIPRPSQVPPHDWGDQQARAHFAKVPDFHRLVNFPDFLTRGRSNTSGGAGAGPAANETVNGMRHCVMCGKLRLCSSASTSNNNSAARNNDSSNNSTDETVHIIPRQNKGVCTGCDVTIWIVIENSSGGGGPSHHPHPPLEIKWCKGCKNFRPWPCFGEKVLATKCIRCRDRQKEKYASQKKGVTTTNHTEETTIAYGCGSSNGFATLLQADQYAV